MFKHARDTQYIKLQRNVPPISENEENLPPNVQHDLISINSAKSVKLADYKSKDAGSKISLKSNLDNTQMKLVDSLTEQTEIKEDLDSTKLSYLTDLDVNSVVAESLPAVSSWKDLDNDFSEVECGEPTVTRQLKIDFTLSEDDTDSVQQKCCDFWNFIYSNPHLNDLMVIPEPDEDLKTQVKVLGENVLSPSSSIPQATAIDMLQKNGEKVPQAFTVKQPVICCNQDNRSYCYGSCARLDKEMTRKLKQEEAAKAKSKKQAPTNPTIDAQPHRSSPSFLSNLCSELDAWDLQHPKSFDPPARVSFACTLEPAAQPRSSSLVSFKEPVCTSDVMCPPCDPSEDGLQLDELELGVRPEE